MTFYGQGMCPHFRKSYFMINTLDHLPHLEIPDLTGYFMKIRFQPFLPFFCIVSLSVIKHHQEPDHINRTRGFQERLHTLGTDFMESLRLHPYLLQHQVNRITYMTL